jgi:hypothetical protein
MTPLKMIEPYTNIAGGDGKIVRVFRVGHTEGLDYFEFINKNIENLQVHLSFLDFSREGESISCALFLKGVDRVSPRVTLNIAKNQKGLRFSPVVLRILDSIVTHGAFHLVSILDLGRIFRCSHVCHNAMNHLYFFVD